LLVPAHGLGGASDLPVPLTAAVVAGGATLVLSFLILTLAWRTPRHTGVERGRLLPSSLAAILDSPWTRWLLRVLGLVAFGYVTWALAFGPDLITNPALGVFYVIVWVGLVPASLVAGPIVRMVSPLRTLHLLLTKVFGISAEKGLVRFPERLGYWPAALGLFAFVWQELVNPNSTYLHSIQIWLACYAGITLLGAALFGDEWFARADPFEVFGTLVGKLSIWGRDPQGRAVVRSPLANLDHVDIGPGLLGVTSVLLGSTAFDSFKGTVRWYQFTEPMKDHEVLVGTLGLLAFCAVVAITFAGAAMATSSTISRGQLPNRYAPSLIPIIVGYFVAHYLTYFYQMGQQTLIQLSDPMTTGANLLGTGNWRLHYGLSNFPTPLAITKVSAIVIGHVLGATAAHDRALAWLPAGHRIRGQLAMMVTMICYTVLGLFLLFSS
jgi:hypothetical protein